MLSFHTICHYFIQYFILLYNISSFYTTFHYFIENTTNMHFQKNGGHLLAKKKPLREYRCEHPTVKHHKLSLFRLKQKQTANTLMLEET